jgi:hypothetical protein
MPPLKVKQVFDAINQVIVTCELRMPTYDSLSLRQGLYDCGYTADQADQVIDYCYHNGFTYCIDTNYASNNELLRNGMGAGSAEVTARVCDDAIPVHPTIHEE